MSHIDSKVQAIGVFGNGAPPLVAAKERGTTSNQLSATQASNHQRS